MALKFGWTIKDVDACSIDLIEGMLKSDQQSTITFKNEAEYFRWLASQG